MSVTASNMFDRIAPTPDTLLRIGVGVVIPDGAGRILLEKRADCGLSRFLEEIVPPFDRYLNSRLAMVR